ncbi:MAG: MBOAT family protein [Robinsoniella sp.]|nr:MBOAT family protein [Robinsoniella sp.]
MVFSSMIFVFLFLPLSLLAYFLCKTTKQKNISLLVSSLIFYSWGGPKYLLILLSMTAICWGAGILIDRSDEEKVRKMILIAAIVLMLAILGYFKYTGFFLGILQGITGFPENIPQIVLPIGISFYTFQLLSYVVDVYRGEVPAQEHYWKLLLYSSLFHQCIAGPIVRYQHVAEEIDHRRVKLSEMADGMTRFMVGLAKKLILADGLATLADRLVPADVSSLKATPALGIWMGILFYMLQIYLDFSAYSDMAIGMGRMVGFHYHENFDYPYVSKSVTEFWRRWHISLGSFFRDYVYIPLGGNRKGKVRQYVNLFIVWFLTGMWHGASWNYIFWGLYFFCFLVLEKGFLLEKFKKVPKVVQHIYLLVVVYFGWILFRFTDLGVMGTALKGMFGLNGNGFSSMQVGIVLKSNIFFIIVAIIGSTPLPKKAVEKFALFCRRRFAIPHLLYAAELIYPIVLLVLSTMTMAGNSYHPFLYFQF